MNETLFILCVLLSTMCSALWIYSYFFAGKSIRGIQHTTFMFASVFFAGAAHLLS